MPGVETDSKYTIMNLFTRDFTFAFLALFSFLSTIYALFPTLPVYLVKLDFSVREIGIVIGVYGASSLAFRFVVGGALLRYPEKNIMIAGSLLAFTSFLASVVFRSFWPFFVIRFLQGWRLPHLTPRHSLSQSGLCRKPIEPRVWVIFSSRPLLPCRLRRPWACCLSTIITLRLFF